MKTKPAIMRPLRSQSLLKKSRGFLILLGSLVFWSALLYFFKPSALIARVGIHNSYLIALILALVGGVSSLTATSLYAAIVALAIAGSNPWLLGFLTGLGVTFGDSIFFYLGLKGRTIIPGAQARTVERFSRWLKQQPCWIISLVIFFYASFIPLPNDILMIALAIVDTPYKKVVLPPLLFGNITFMVLISILARHGVNLFH